MIKMRTVEAGLAARQRHRHDAPPTIHAAIPASTAIFGARRDQAFPTLAEADVDRMRRFGYGSVPHLPAPPERTHRVLPGATKKDHCPDKALT
ncbi:hypothetical protein LB543_32695 [Mesorhizobium sp. ESP7-2]|uniref:hypothetical protein n=1 Tax=Mesorhizobium sp. ESP7-2 TaxID=2876622 RepID=UPI001CD035EB|nr:hypothetical protein [Mesorhizobium sp. ESP7-2]MBZ9711454.1 hypothetical protein [Mesorhizobium sp. ESP7-2]